MSFGSFLRGIAAQVNPFDNGQTYGTFNPPQKKKDDQNNPFGNPQPAPRPAPSFNFNQNNNQPQVQKPQNLFAGLNNDLQLPGAPKNTLPLNQNTDLSPLLKPQPGSVVTPTNQDQQQRQKLGIPSYVTKLYHDNNGNITGYEDPQKLQDVQVVPNKPQQPQQSFWHRLTHNVITNGTGTALKDTGEVLGGVGTAAAAGTLRAGEGLVTGVTSLPAAGAHAGAFIGEKLTGQNSYSPQVQRLLNKFDTATNTVNAPVNWLAKKTDMIPGMINHENGDQTLAGRVASDLYKPVQVAANVATVVPAAETIASKVPLLSRLPIIGDRLSGLSDFVNSQKATPTITRIINNFRPNAVETGASEAGALGEAGEGAQAAETAEGIGQGQQQPTQVNVKSPNDPGTPIPVKTPPTDNPWLIPKIKEIGGDFNFPTEQELQQIRTTNTRNAADAFNSNARPDQSVGGIIPPKPAPTFRLSPDTVHASQDDVVQQYAQFLKDMGEGNGTQLVPDGEGGYIRTSNNYRSPGVGSDRMTKQDWLDQAQKELESGKAEPGAQQAFADAANPDVQSLLAKGDTTQEAPVGKPITVKEVKGIPVVDKTEPTVVPAANTPETPGTVRPTTVAAPANEQAAAVAAQPNVKPPAQIPVPAETQAILDNPKNFTKRQVQAARNQLKLARQMAKTAEKTNEAMDRLTNAKPTSDKGFVPTGEFRQGAQGNVTQSASKAAEAAQGAHDIANLSVDDVLQQARQEVAENGVVSPQTVRNLKALRESGTLSRTSPEFKAVSDEYKNAISHHARALSLTDRTARTTASGDQLANRFASKIIAYADDSSKLTDAHMSQIEQAENAFTQARDAATAAGEQFKASGSPEDFKAWKAAQQAAEQADRQAKITEFLVAKDVLKGNKNLDAIKAVQEAEKNAGVYSMDSIDSNMLSGTGTMVRNYINTLFPRVENKLFGRASSLAVRKLAPIGGSSGRGARIGAKIGRDMFKADVQARKAAGVGFIRRTVTAGNTVGERNIQATAYSKAFSHYKQLLKDEGYKGAELNNRAEFNVRTDPDGLVAQYERDTLQANALSSLTHTKKIENVLADGIQKKLSEAGVGVKGQTAGRFGAKAVTRVGLGFPTVIARSLGEGFKRATLGLPEAGWATAKYMMSGNKEAFAQDLSKAIQHAGTGGSLFLLGSALGQMGVISGAYPSDPAERARWEAEGRQENSINIGGQWFNIPGYLGGFALPLMLGATTSAGNIKDAATLKNAWSTILSASPVDNIQSTLDILTGNSSAAKTKNAVTSLVRSVTPAGSFLAEVAKLTDSTANDTTQKDAVHNILDQIAGGIPGLNNAVNKTPKLDSYGNVIKNPNKVATVLGAQGATQSQGTQDVNKEQGASDQTLQEIGQYGVFGDKNLSQLIDPKIAKQLQEGQQLSPQDVQKVQKAVTKGIDASTDSNWRESGEYATDKAAMQVKLQMLNADPTTKPSEKAKYQLQINRDDVLQKNNIPYDVLKQYESTSLSQWRDMGDPYSQSYDPQTYQLLWNIDQVMAQGKASYNTKDPATQKFSAKQAGSGSGRGGRRGSPVTGDFGKLGNTTGAPTVQKYETINTQAGNIPIITPVRPNIVHNISSSG